MQRKALIIKLGAIGDAAMAIPAVCMLHDSGYEIDWLCGRSIAPLLSCYSWINPLVLDDRKLLQGNKLDAISVLLRSYGMTLRRYDFAALLHYDPRYRFLMLPVRARQKLQMNRADRTLAMVAGRHHSDEYARLLLMKKDQCTAYPVRPVRPDRLVEGAAAQGTGGARRVVLVPAGARNLLRDDGLRRWPIQFYVALTEVLLSRGYHVVLSGGPDDVWALEHFRNVPIDNQIGKLSIPETISLYARSAAVVTHDTGPLHLAGLTQCGIVGLFGPTDPRTRLPRRSRVTGIWGGEGFACRPCYDGRDYAPCSDNGCMASISVSVVASEIERLLHQTMEDEQALPRIVPAR